MLDIFLSHAVGAGRKAVMTGANSPPVVATTVGASVDSTRSVDEGFSKNDVNTTVTVGAVDDSNRFFVNGNLALEISSIGPTDDNVKFRVGGEIITDIVGDTGDSTKFPNAGIIVRGAATTGATDDRTKLLNGGETGVIAIGGKGVRIKFRDGGTLALENTVEVGNLGDKIKLPKGTMIMLSINLSSVSAAGVSNAGDSSHRC